MTDASEVRATLDERPDLESPLRAVLAVDEDRDAWTFDDVDVDSGRFGELVSTGIVEKTAGGDYRLADRAAVRAALDGETAVANGSGTADVDLSVSLPSLEVEPRLAVALGGALLVVVLARTVVSFDNVFYDGAVVLSGNDPYFYRYWVDQVLQGRGVDALPPGIQKGEPMLVALAAGAAAVFGGTQTAGGMVLAWYPVVAAVLTALMVYGLGVVVTDDHRVGLAAILMLAFTPGHVFRTSLGYADHHALDFVWLALTVLSLAVLARWGTERDARTLAAVAGLGVGIAGQVLAWEAGPLLVFPVATYLLGRVVLDVRDGRSPLAHNGAVLVGLALGALLAGTVHLWLEWQTDVVGFAPLLLFGGAVGLVATAEAIHRVEIPSVEPHVALAAVEAVGVVGSGAFLALVLPTYWERLTSELGRIGTIGGIAEGQSLFSNSFGFILLFGFVLALALPYMLWGTREAVRGSTTWLVAAVYGWHFLLLASFQIRFVGEIASFTALFAGLGLVHLASAVDVAARPEPFRNRSGRPTDTEHRLPFELPNRRQLGALVVLFLMVSSFGIIQSFVKTNQVTIGHEMYDTAANADAWAAEHDLEYPRNYVFSQWGRNRVFNYFVSGESRGYGYARSHYNEFVARSQSTEKWYERLRASGRSGFVVIDTIPGGSQAPETSVYRRLYSRYGRATETYPGTSHFRAVYVSSTGTYKTFAVVPGANVTGRSEPNTTVVLEKPVTIEGASFTYTRRATATADGRFVATVPYPGEYTVERGNTSTTVTVPESAVMNGGNVSVS